MHDIVYSLAQLSNNDVEHLDKDKNANDNDGILIQPVFLYAKNQLHWRMEAWVRRKKTLLVALGRRW